MCIQIKNSIAQTFNMSVLCWLFKELTLL